MPGLVANRAVLLVGDEVVYGTPIAVTGADAILVRNVVVNPEVEINERVKLDTSLAPHTHIMGRRKQRVTFDLDLKHSGTAVDTAPKLARLLRGCGMLITINAAVSVVATPISSFKLSETLNFYCDGVLHSFSGAVGNVTMAFPAGELPVLSFDFVGLYADPTDAAFPGGLTFDPSDPVAVLNISCLFDGFAPVTKGITLASNNTIAERLDACSIDGFAGFLITARAWAGTWTVEEELVATRPWVANLIAGVGKAASFAIGTVAGNIISIAVANLIKDGAPLSEEDGVKIRALSFKAYESALAADDEVSFTMT